MQWLRNCRRKITAKRQCLDNLSVANWEGFLKLLIIQPSPFCNLNCDYCYLPDRLDTRKMDLSTLDVAARKIFGANLPGSFLSVVWHAGEPLTVSREWYVAAFKILANFCPPSTKLIHNFQTNGVLIDGDWVSFFREHDIRVGISLDGPAWLHDKHRHTWDAQATHAKVMRGIDFLQKADFPFHVICVLTRDSLNHAEEVLNFFSEVQPVQLCFNIEEIESAHRSSSLAEDVKDTELAYRLFMSKILDQLRFRGYGANSRQENSKGMMRIREIDEVLASLRHPEFGLLGGNAQNLPGHIISIAWDGRYTTFSPELLGQTWPNGDELALGNLLLDTLPPSQDNVNYSKQCSAIQQGIDRCKSECEYFNLCLGGAPANKLAENGGFETSETLFCKLTKKILIDVVLESLEKDLPN